jgi:hypothetical protein
MCASISQNQITFQYIVNDDLRRRLTQFYSRTPSPAESPSHRHGGQTHSLLNPDSNHTNIIAKPCIIPGNRDSLPDTVEIDKFDLCFGIQSCSPPVAASTTTLGHLSSIWRSSGGLLDPLRNAYSL